MEIPLLFLSCSGLAAIIARNVKRVKQTSFGLPRRAYMAYRVGSHAWARAFADTNMALAFDARLPSDR
ncbi:MAG: hypothetical protein J0H25_07995, partial [Rhizobiales bacterium]|nr:hypothetical protein [Hyphomicrobiales bacterium]